MKKAQPHVHTTRHSFDKNRFRAFALWNFAVIVIGSSSLQSTPFTHIFIPSCQSPGGVCGQSVLHQWCGVFFGGLHGWGPAPLCGPLTPGSEDFQGRTQPLGGVCFLARGEKPVCLYHPISGKGCEVTFSEVPVPSGPPVRLALSHSEVLQTCRGQRGNEGLIRDILSFYLKDLVPSFLTQLFGGKDTCNVFFESKKENVFYSHASRK